MAYITFIADGEEVNVYCGYISGVAVNGVTLIPTQSKPVVRYTGDRLSEKIDLDKVQNLSIKTESGNIPLQRYQDTLYRLPASTSFLRRGDQFLFSEDSVKCEPQTRIRFTGQNGFILSWFKGNLMNNIAGAYTINNISSVTTPNQLNIGLFDIDLMPFQISDTKVIFLTPTHFTPLNWLNLQRSADEAGGGTEYPVWSIFGSLKFPKKNEKLYSENTVNPPYTTGGLNQLFTGEQYITSVGNTLVINSGLRGIQWQNVIQYNNPQIQSRIYMYWFIMNNIMANNDITEPPDTPDNDDGGDGDEDDSTDNVDIPEPPSIFPTNSKLFTLYRLETSQLDQLGGLLWSKDFMDTIFGVNQSPIDAIIDIYALPISDLSGTYELVKVGNTNTQISAQIPSKWTVTINCGNLYLQRYYDDFVDYMASYQIYLPFIGLRPLTTDLTGSTLNVQYIIDLLTGNCTAFIYDVQGKTGLSSCLFSYNGNCSYSVPYTGQNLRNQAVKRLSGYAGTVQSIVTQDWGGLIKNVKDYGLNEFATQGQGIVTEDTGGCSAYLNVMCPFVIVTRVKKHKNDYAEKVGKQFYSNSFYSDLQGFTRLVDPHLSFSNLTDEENKRINQILSEGVIF